MCLIMTQTRSTRTIVLGTLVGTTVIYHLAGISVSLRVLCWPLILSLFVQLGAAARVVMSFFFELLLV